MIRLAKTLPNVTALLYNSPYFKTNLLKFRKYKMPYSSTYHDDADLGFSLCPVRCEDGKRSWLPILAKDAGTSEQRHPLRQLFMSGKTGIYHIAGLFPHGKMHEVNTSQFHSKSVVNLYRAFILYIG